MSKKQKNITQGIGFILISALMFGSYGVWSRLIGEDLGVFYQGWSRALLISIVLFPILHYRKEIVPIEKQDRGWLVVFLVFTSLTQAPIFYAFNHMDIGTASLIFFVSMLLTMYLVGVVFLGEKMTKVKIASFVLALIGMYVVFSFSLTAFALLAALMAVVNGIASGGEVSFSKKLTGAYSVLYITWLSWIVIVLTNAPISMYLGEVQHVPSLDIVWLWQVLYAVAGVLGFGLIIAGLKHVEAGIGGLIGLLEIVFSITFGVLIFSEELTMKVIVGAILILVAAGLPHIQELVEKKKRTS